MNFARSMSRCPTRSAPTPSSHTKSKASRCPSFTATRAPLVPGWYGVSHVKWLERIELSPRRFMAGSWDATT